MLTKGFEIEIYTGTRQGQIVGFAHRISTDLEGFVCEPDNRNVEYITSPTTDYDKIVCDLIGPRQRLRQYLHNIGDYTVIPGSSLSLGESKRFYRSSPDNPYHEYIEKTYGTDVVTASVHINVGVKDSEDLIRLCRLIRMEAAMYLALSASSPFLDNDVTGYHSTRWMLFPKTHSYVPLFRNHQHYIDWTLAQLEMGTMQNVRHLWTTVRPNGKRRPYEIDRLELRICDLVIDPISLVAITALLEARMLQAITDKSLDPLAYGKFSDTPEDLLAIAEKNEKTASQFSLSARGIDWRDGREKWLRDWVTEIYEEVFPIARKNGFVEYLIAVKRIVEEGNEAQKWLEFYDEGMKISQILAQAISETEYREIELSQAICH